MDNIRGKICKIISEMLDNPDDCGIYQTTKCYDQLEELFKAPKNELVPLDETEVHKTLLQARKDWENDPHHMSGEMYQLSAEATAIFSKFGSSGKRSLSQYDLSVFLRKQPFLSHLQADLLAERVVKKFSTAEVSLETIEKALSSIPSTHFPISKMNGKHYYYMCKEDIAKAIKRELDGK